MADEFRKFHTLDITINGNGPFTSASEIRGGLSATLFYDVSTKFVFLHVNFKADEHTTKHYRILTLRPGDRIKFTYDGPNEDSGLTIDKIEELSNASDFSPKDGFRIGMDVYRPTGEKVRLSHPQDGGFNVMLGNVPLDHTRVWAGAGNGKEEWNWQLDDLYAGDSIEFEIVETDWCDPFPKVSHRNLVNEE